jgi:hypothetical protein
MIFDMKWKVSIGMAAAVFLFSFLSAFGFAATADGYTMPLRRETDRFGYEPQAPYRAFTVFVGGNVEREGPYNVQIGMTYGTLFSAAGFRDFAGIDPAEKIDPLTTVLLSNMPGCDSYNINYPDAESILALSVLIGAPAAEAIFAFRQNEGMTDDKEDLWKKGYLEKIQFDAVKYYVHAFIGT